MDAFDLSLVATSLSMDAFAASICKGAEARGTPWKVGIIAGLYFGAFQALMPIVGYFLGSAIQQLIAPIAGYVAFGILAFVGIGMVRESLNCANDSPPISLRPRIMLPIAIATSIDALVVGVTFAALEVKLLPAAALIGLATFLFSAMGCRIGAFCGNKLGTKANLLGGIALILIGAKIAFSS